MGKPSCDRAPTHGRLLDLLEYDPTTGVFRWRHRTSNRINIGDVAGSIARGLRGPYRVIGIDGRRQRASALAIFYVLGEWPEELVDHKNHDTLDDSFENIRPASYQENSFNTSAHSDNSTGFKGVHLHSDGRYRAQISIDRKRIHLGLFHTPLQAHQAYLAAAKAMHGEFFNGGDNRKA